MILKDLYHHMKELILVLTPILRKYLFVSFDVHAEVSDPTNPYWDCLQSSNHGIAYSGGDFELNGLQAGVVESRYTEHMHLLSPTKKEIKTLISFLTIFLLLDTNHLNAAKIEKRLTSEISG